MRRNSSPQAPREKAPFRHLKAIAPYALKRKGKIAAALVALVIAALATLVLPVALRRVIDTGFSEGNTGLANSYFLMLIAVVAVLAIASSFRFYLVTSLGERIVADLRADVFRHITRLDVGFFDTSRSGDLASRLTADTTQIKSAFSVSASIALRNAMLFIGALVMMVLTSPQLSALVMGAIPLIVIPLVFSGRKVRARSREAQDRLADASAYATEAAGAARTMQAFGAEQATASRFADAAEDAFEAARRALVSRAWLSGAAIFMISASIVFVLWTGASEVFAGRMTGGRLSQFILYAVFAASALGQLSEVYGEISAAAGAAGRLGEILATKPAITAPAAPKALPEPAAGMLAFAGVTFRYPGREENALTDVSFALKPGERVALVGPSGAGKSSVLQLALRFYDPQQGAVRIDGIAGTEADPSQWRQRLALVAQDPVVFGASVAENIRYGRPGASDADIREAARLAASASASPSRAPS